MSQSMMLHQKARGASRPPKGMGACIAFLREHVDHVAEECLLWPFTKTRDGHGRLRIVMKFYIAHTVMCALAHGQRPSPRHIAMRSCSTKSCVNPGHLSWRTRKDLNKRIAERRAAAGHGWFKLSADDVSQIRAIGSDTPTSKLAGMFGCSVNTIRRVVIGTTWNERTMLAGPAARRGLVLTAAPIMSPSFYVPAARGVEFSADGSSAAVAITQPVETPVMLLSALERLHPAVKAMVMNVLGGAQIDEAAQDAGIDPDKIPLLMPRLRTFLAPYVSR